jgi:hypothetical protein
VAFSLFRVWNSLQYAATYQYNEGDNTNTFMPEPTILADSDESTPIKPSTEKYTTGTGSSVLDGVVVVVEREPSLSFDNSSSFLELSYFSSKPECSTPLLPHQVSMTLTTQLSLDRMWMMKYQCDRWPVPYPISIAVYLPHDDKRNESFVTDELQRLGCDLNRMTITLLKDRKDQLEDYPVNQLRNLALEAVQTSHAAYIDSDFMISRGLWKSLMQTALLLVANNASRPVAIVMPAFEYYSSCSSNRDSDQHALGACLDQEHLPETHDDMIALLDRPKQQRPRALVGFHTFDGSNRYHGSTNYLEWRKNGTTESLKLPCIRRTSYEPYLAVRMCRDLPRFPEVFQGWGWNKVVWIRLLWKKLGYELWQVPREFVIHLPHPLSKAARNRKGDNYKPPAVERWMHWFDNDLPDHENRLPDCKVYKKQKEAAAARKKAVGN